MARAPAATTAKGRARRVQVLNAALPAFAEQGYRGASIAAIADEVGLSEPGLLHHFPSKAALLLETLEYHQERTYVGASRPVGTSTLRFADRLYAVAARHERDPGFIRLLIVLAAESTDPCHPAHEWFVARYERVRVAFTRQFAADQGAGLLDPEVDPAQLARAAAALMDGLQLQFLLSEGATDIVTPLRAMLDPLYRD
jgi:AcrR family transcriptional regulator